MVKVDGKLSEKLHICIHTSKSIVSLPLPLSLLFLPLPSAFVHCKEKISCSIRWRFFYKKNQPSVCYTIMNVRM